MRHHCAVSAYVLSLSSNHGHLLVDRCEEEVQPFQEAVAGNESESSPWAYLQKTYSNTDEAVPGASKGPSDHSQEGGPTVAMPADLPVQVSKTNVVAVHTNQCQTVPPELHA